MLKKALFLLGIIVLTQALNDNNLQ